MEEALGLRPPYGSVIGVRVQRFDTNFMVSLPRNKQLEIPTHIRRQGYFSEHGQMYFFRVTEEQFFELTNDFFDSVHLSRQYMKGREEGGILYTFEELFGGLIPAEQYHGQMGSFWANRGFQFVEVWPHAANDTNQVHIISVGIYEEDGGLYALICIDGVGAILRLRVIAKTIEIGNTIEFWYIADEYRGGPSRMFGESVWLLSLVREEENIVAIWGYVRPALEENKGDGMRFEEMEDGFESIFRNGFPPIRFIPPEPK